jgi:3-oxoacyl-[acyl-carrier protein] reductase
VAVVTGGAGAIGSAVGARLLGAGCSVAVWDVPETLHARPGHPQLLEVPCDVTDPAQVASALEATERAMGDPSFLVNAVGVGQYAEPFSAVDFARWRDIVTVDLVGAMACVHAVLPAMTRRRSGVIVNICSIWSTNVATGRSAYIAAKSGLLAATKAVAAEVIDAGVRVCAVSPGPVDSPMTVHIAPEAVRRSWMTPSDVAEVVWFALGPQAAHLVGGEIQLFGAVRPAADRGPSTRTEN